MDAHTRARLLSLFVVEAEDAFANLDGLLAQLTPQADDEIAVKFGRVTHGLKGAAAAVGLEQLSEQLHALEETALRFARLGPEERAELQVKLGSALGLLQTIAASISGTGLGESARGALEKLQALLSTPGRTILPAPAAASAASAAAPTAPASPGQESSLERISVESEQVDEALRLASAVARAAVELSERGSRSDEADPQAEELAQSAERLETLIISLRLVRAAEAFSGLEQEVHRLGRRLNKEVRFVLEGGAIRADRRTLQLARGLVRHLIRNAVDHGIEAPAQRQAVGKNPEGTITLRVNTSESQLWVEVSDDGAGFDVPAIRAKLQASSELSGRVQGLSDEEVLHEFATRGGSTRGSATEISGRGLGLSAVVEHVGSRGGNATVSNQRGKGCSVSLRFPLELFATEVLTMTTGGQGFALPLDSISRAFCLTAQDGEAKLQVGPGGSLLAFDERIVAFQPLAAAIGLEAQNDSCRFALVVRDGERESAFGVAELGLALRVIPRTAPPAIQPGALVTGVAQLPDRTRVELLSPRMLLSGQHTAAAPGKIAAANPTRLLVLLAEDSLATREVLRVLLEREGHEVRVAGDGMEAQERVAERVPDVVVTDLNMPRCDGLSLTRALRSRPASAKVPIIILTSQDDEKARAAAQAAGASAYLLKSRFNSGVLEHTLKGLSGRAS